MRDFLLQLQHILEKFLGLPKNNVTDGGQLQFGCPHCIDTYGDNEKNKFNLECNIIKGRFNCWKCSSTHDEMHGSIYKLIKVYGNDEILKEYGDAISSFKQSKLYELHFKKNELNFETDFLFDSSLQLPSNYIKLEKDKYIPKTVKEYLDKRNIGWDIIDEFKIGYTVYDRKQIQLSTRIILPSYDEYGQLNYWTGRDYSKLPNRQKYFNPIVERKDIVFNENKVQWDSDITLVEGPFDHIVVPNSIPLLGKSLKSSYLIYSKLMTKANANVNIFLDGDAFNDVKKIYSLLNQGKLHGKIRYIPVNKDLDPSEIYQSYGYNGIIKHLQNATEINEVYLF